MPLPITTSFRFISGAPEAQKKPRDRCEDLSVLTQIRGVALTKQEACQFLLWEEKAGLSGG
jgi:hypothetical protein